VSALLAAQTARQAVVSRGLTATDWIVAAVIFALGIGASAVLRAVLGRAIRRGDSERAATDVITRVVGWVVVTAALFWSLALLGVRVGPLFGALGIGGLAVAFAAQSILGNLLASIILQIRRPFRRGDQISTNDCEGVVEDVNFRTVRLRTYDGERVLVPCAEVLSKPIINHTTLGRRRTTLDVRVSYDCDLADTRDLLLGTVRGAEGVLERPAPEVWVKEFDDSSINLVVRFWHAPDVASMWRVRNHVAIAVKEALDRAGVEIPFPQRTISFAADLSTRSGDEGPARVARLRSGGAQSGDGNGEHGSDGR
jgi:small-conductance mechanosensitive channel